MTWIQPARRLLSEGSFMPVAAPDEKAVARGASHEILGPLQKLVASNRRRWKMLVALEALSLAIAAPLGYFWAVVILDDLVPLPRLGRFLATAGLVAGLV